MFREEHFREIFEGFVLLCDNCDLFCRKSVCNSSFDVLRYPSKFVRFGLEDILRHTSALSVVRIEGLDRSWKYIPDGM